MPHGVAMVGITYPLDPADYAALQPVEPPPSLLGLGGLVVPRNSSYIFEVCRPCVDGILPMLASLKTEYLQRLVDERRAAIEGGPRYDTR
jgi:hypothetical protein